MCNKKECCCCCPSKKVLSIGELRAGNRYRVTRVPFSVTNIKVGDIILAFSSGNGAYKGLRLKGLFNYPGIVTTDGQASTLENNLKQFLFEER